MNIQNTQQQKQFNILLIGDDCLDVYQYGTVDRISPEAPVPVFKFSYEETKPGMAANVKENLEAFGCIVTFLSNGVSCKTRLIDIKSKQQIVRIDDDAECIPLEFATAIPKVYDAIVISDYNKGTISYEVVEEIRKDYKGPIFVDTKKTDLKRFDGCFVKINQLEYSKVISETFSHKLIVTLGSEGAMHDGNVYDAPSVEVVDVTGAGDTFLAALTFGYLKYQNIDEAIKLAIKASAVTVQHMGVYAPKMEEM
jgi:D-beta-D-heptose 7-phosphate kinase/D-beta-D-heptose 1-phosphate adenosyltransferase